MADYVFRQHEWHHIKGRSAKRFAQRVWANESDGTNPVFTTYNGREVMVYHNQTFRKGDYVGSYTVTPEQLANRPPATVTKVKANSPRYAPVHDWKRRE